MKDCPSIHISSMTDWLHCHHNRFYPCGNRIPRSSILCVRFASSESCLLNDIIWHHMRYIPYRLLNRNPPDGADAMLDFRFHYYYSGWSSLEAVAIDFQNWDLKYLHSLFPQLLTPLLFLAALLFIDIPDLNLSAGVFLALEWIASYPAVLWALTWPSQVALTRSAPVR